MEKTTWRDVQEYLTSLWSLEREDNRPLDFHGAFIPAVAEGVILRHTQPGDWVWDPMAGSGTTAMVANYLGRRCFMSDLTPRAPDIYQADARTLDLRTEPVFVDEKTHHFRPVIHQADARESVLTNAKTGSPQSAVQFSNGKRFLFDLVILHPPYHNIIQFSDKKYDLSNCSNLGLFSASMREVAQNVAKQLKPGGYVALVMGDIWVESEVVPLGFETMRTVMGGLGVTARLKAIVVKDIKHNRARAGQHNLWSSRYFKWGAVHFAHEYIFSIQKGK